MNNVLDNVYLNHSMIYEQSCRQTEVYYMSKSGILSGLFIFFIIALNNIRLLCSQSKR